MGGWNIGSDWTASTLGEAQEEIVRLRGVLDHYEGFLDKTIDRLAKRHHEEVDRLKAALAEVLAYLEAGPTTPTDTFPKDKDAAIAIANEALGPKAHRASQEGAGG